jgi:dihydroorotate dehydrogenase electron transfer subunit
MLEQTVLIEFNKQIGKNIWLIGFSSSQLASIANPGQFVMIRLGKEIRDPLLRRPFSIHNIQGNGRVLILYKVVGTVTSMMTSLKKDDNISVIGPLGKGFPLPQPDEKTILVAGGMGVAPLFFLIQTLKKIQKNNITVLLGFSTSQEVILVDRLKDQNVDLFFTTEDGSLGARGLVTDLLDQNFGREISGNPVIYACGPVSMLKKVAQKAYNSNLKCYVSLECCMACGLGICLGCAIKAADGQGSSYYYVCKDGPVFPHHVIDWEVL